MNILQQEDIVKGLPDERLMSEAKTPTGQVPQFLVVSEIQRRTDMRKRFEAQEQQPPGTVSDQIISQGIAAMGPAQQQPPQQPQGPPPQQMYDGGLTRLAEGGLVQLARGGVVPETGYSQYDSLIENYASQYGLDPEQLKRQIMVESNFDPSAVSGAGAIGLMQVMPSTAADPGYGMTGIDPATLTDPETNIAFGAEYMSKMQDKFDGDPAKALQAYHSGPGNVDSGNIGPAGQVYPENVLASASVPAEPVGSGITGIITPKASSPEPGVMLPEEGDKDPFTDSPFSSAYMFGRSYGDGNRSEAISSVKDAVGDYLVSNSPGASEARKAEQTGIAGIIGPAGGTDTTEQAAEILAGEVAGGDRGIEALLAIDSVEGKKDPGSQGGSPIQTQGTGLAGLLAMKNREPITPPDYSDLVARTRNDSLSNALIQLGAGVAGNDLSGGLARAGVASAEGRREANDFEARSRLLGYEGQQKEVDRDIAILGRAGVIEATRDRAEADRMIEAGRSARAVLSFIESQVELSMEDMYFESKDGMTSQEVREQTRQALIRQMMPPRLAMELGLERMLAGDQGNPDPGQSNLVDWYD